MRPDELNRLERERVDADQRYNDALTALDRAVIAAASGAAEPLARVGSALMVFLQQITSLVDTKQRALEADTRRQIESLSHALDGIAELNVRVGVLQRSLRAQSGQVATLEPPTSRASAAAVSVAPFSGQDAATYVGFEDQFRGSDAAIRERVRPYVAIFSGRTNVIDIGCGRGELLAELKSAGVAARGVDANQEMATVARDRGLDAAAGDALAFLSSLPDESVGGIAATQVIEHLEPAYLLRLIQTAVAKLEPGAPIVLETINPACWLAFFSSYIRDLTHVRPIHPDTLQYLLRASGFERVDIRYSAPVPEAVRMKTLDLPAEIVSASDPASRALSDAARAINTNAAILNNLMFSHLDYAAIGYRS